MITPAAFPEFTEAGFRKLLRRLIDGGYRFASYGAAADDRHVLWRHDVDLSMHRAARLAEIEAESGAAATYFIHLRSSFYSMLETSIIERVRHIRALGHEIGLHFDGAAYATTAWDRPALNAAIARERALLETILDMSVRCVSWHNPDLSNLLDFDDEHIGGLANAYAARLRRNYVYCSDSNGYWRFSPMDEVISEDHERLHLLTHPEWWTPEALSPSGRVDRAIMGRARVTRADYDALLAGAGRTNLK